jgi:hypothetical protein
MVPRARAGCAVLVLTSLAAPALGSEVLTCLTHESWTKCTADLDLETDREPDKACDAPVTTAGFCVCKQEGCDADANLIRIETACDASCDERPAPRQCTTCDEHCAAYTSDLWILGILSSTGASFSTAAGLVIQKIAHMRTQALPVDKRPPMFFGFIVSPLWVLGFVLLVICPLPFNLLAVTWAAASLVAPLASVTLVLNQCLAPCTLNEKLTRTDIAATAVIVAGVVLATAFGTHCESSYKPDDLLLLYTRVPFLIMAACIVLAILLAFFTARRWRKTQPDVLESDENNRIQAPTSVTISYAFMAGAYGAVMQIVFKGTGELVGAGAWDSPALWASAVAIIPLATTQMAYLNTGMQVCDAVKFFPSYNASLIVMMTITGMIYYEEYKGLQGLKGWGCFVAGISLVVAGVLLLTLRNSTESPSKDQVVPAPPGSEELAGGEEGSVVDDEEAAAAAAAAKDGTGSAKSSRPNSAGEYPNGMPIQRKSSFTIPMAESGKQLAVNSLPFVDPRSVSNPGTPRGRSPSPAGGTGADAASPDNAPGMSPGSAQKLPPLQLPTIQGGDTPMQSMTADESESLKKALAQREAEQSAQLAAQLQEKLEGAAKEREAIELADGAEPAPPGVPEP